MWSSVGSWPFALSCARAIRAMHSKLNSRSLRFIKLVVEINLFYHLYICGTAKVRLLFFQASVACCFFIFCPHFFYFWVGESALRPGQTGRSLLPISPSHSRNGMPRLYPSWCHGWSVCQYSSNHFHSGISSMRQPSFSGKVMFYRL